MSTDRIKKVRIQESVFDGPRLLALLEAEVQNELSDASIGASCVFTGTMRDLNEGDNVQRMTLEHYAGMTERVLADIVDKSIEKHGLIDARVVHRVGDINPNEPIVMVAVWSSHRKAAFDACREIMEYLKSEAPFWKREMLTNQTQRWVEKNTPG